MYLHTHTGLSHNTHGASDHSVYLIQVLADTGGENITAAMESARVRVHFD